MAHDGELFINKINKVIKNNEHLYYGKNDDEIKKSEGKDINIRQKINDIFKSKNYIYKADVIIKTNKGEIKTSIIGKNSKNLITNESELIPIADILDIEINKKTV
nr:hypothetical protein [Bacilli bacterium]